MYRSGDIFRFDGWPDTLLIGPCAAFGQDASSDWDGEHLARSRLRAMRQDSAAMAMLRSAAERWGFPPPNTLPDGAAIERVAAEVANGYLTALVLPTGDARLRHVTWGSGWTIAGDGASAPGGSPEDRLARLLADAAGSRALMPPDPAEMARLLEPGLLPDAVALLRAWTELAGARWAAIFAAFLDADELDGDARTAAEVATELDALLDILADARDDNNTPADFENLPETLARLVDRIGAHAFVGTVIREIERGVHPTPSVVPKTDRAPPAKTPKQTVSRPDKAKPEPESQTPPPPGSCLVKAAKSGAPFVKAG